MEETMGDYFNIDGGLVRFLSRASDICIIGIIWLICCLPIVTFGASTTAAYYTIIKVVKRQRGTLYREFIQALKKNFKDSVMIHCFYLVIEGFLVFNIYHAYQVLETRDSAMALNQLFIYAAFLLLMMAAGIYTYPALSRFSMKRKELIQFSFIAMCRHLPITILLIAVFFALFGVMALLPVGIIFMPGISLYLYSLIMEPVLRKYMTEEMKIQWDGEEE
jgi:uncharacterized membrane protein YesL